MDDIVLVMGYPASGKSSLVVSAKVASNAKGEPWPRVLNRDTAGGSMSDLAAEFRSAAMTPGPILLDNTFGSREERKPFLDAARAAGRSVVCRWMTTSAEDAQINALHRMWDRYNQVFLDAGEIKAHKEAKNDPNMFPAAAIFSYRKRFEEPTVEEGFVRIDRVSFVRRPATGTQKALILDYDGTLRRDAREIGGPYAYPTRPEHVEVLPGRAEKLREYEAQGYLLLGASNQSGIAKGHLTTTEAIACFRRTNELLGVKITHAHCKHGSFPVSCYCRKPQSGLGVYLTRQYDLNPAETIMVGDMGTDRTFATRMGFQFVEADKFFATGAP